ncbi:hypothetical protein [Malacoplasma iowae]|uniref:P35 lipoprotein family protein n=1 Tax=Malacoplasma iowae DK-CPA TaxID=1394179 RepID=A0A084U449_MALIO|nr:hypothetical protein [Malacoplasma iowae]KFB07735.1 hypothetical protein P271_592 [Malacoplasma iowae DK-CPA]WPL40815.1 hypothetical protein QX184_04760 [Malacoplasma iowae]
MKKRKLLIAPLLLSLSAVSAGAIISATSTNQNHLNTSINNISTRGFETEGGGAETGTTFSYQTEDEVKKLDWYGKYNVEEFSKLENANDLIKQLVKPSTTTNFTVQIDENISEDMKTNAYLNFTVTWNKNNGDRIYTQQQVKPNGSKETETGGTNWDTKKFGGLFKSTKYQVVWNDNETIKKYILSENRQVSQIQSSDVIKYLISPSSNLPNNFESMIKINQNGSNNSENNKYGVLDISFQNATKNNNEWVDNALPQSKKFRGFIGSDNVRYEVQIKPVISSITNITATSPENGAADPFGTVFQGLNDRNISSLTPSQFVSVVGDSQTNGNEALIKMLTEGKFLSISGQNGNSAKFIDIEYMGKSYTDSNFESTTGIKGSPSSNKNGEQVDKIEVIGVRTIPNDTDGSLQIVYTIKTFDVYTSSYVTTEFTQSFAANTFKTASTHSENLSFEWKDSNSIPNNLGATFDIVNEFRAKSDNDETFRKSFTNMFFNGSDDVYNKNRSATIDYRTTHTSEDDNGNWVSSNQDTSITVTVTFDDWGGAVYKDENGEYKKGFKSTSTFYIGIYQYDTQYQKPNWVDNTQLFNSNAAYREMTPSQVTYSISQSENDNSPFYGQYNAQVGTTPTTIMIPNDSEGIITVKLVLTVQKENTRATAENLIFSQTYTGFKQDNSDNNFQEFGWIPASEVDPQLLAIPIYLVKKSDVIDLYLNKIPLFASLNISEDDVEIDSYVDPNTNVGVLRVSVHISSFNQAASNQSNVGTTVQNTISGFSTVTSSNLANINPPVDNTALISVSCAVLVSVMMSTVLLALISRRAKIRSFKVKKDKTLNLNKKQGKSSLDAFADELENKAK